MCGLFGKREWRLDLMISAKVLLCERWWIFVHTIAIYDATLISPSYFGDECNAVVFVLFYFFGILLLFLSFKCSFGE